MKVWFPAIKVSSGADIFVQRLSDALRVRGVETEVTWFSRFYEFVPFLLKNKTPPHGTDIIHVNSWNGFAFKHPDIPLVVTEHHCVFDPDYRPFKSFLQHLYHQGIIKKYEVNTLQSGDAFTAVSKFTAECLARFANMTDVRAIYNWVNTNSFKPAVNQSPERKEKFHLLYVGNMSRRKGFDLLIPIMKKLGTDFILRFSSGLRTTKVKSYPDNMIHLGRLSEADLIREYQKCDALLFPSRFEGFGYVILEAMACGKPVIATNATSIPEIVDDGVTGILCRRDDVNGFAKACRKLADDKALCLRMGLTGRKRVEEFFSEETAFSEYIKLYKNLLV